MTIYAFVASHRIIDLTTVALLSNGASSVPETLTSDTAGQLGVEGSVVLATCNRLEVYIKLAVPEHLAPVSELIFAHIAAQAGGRLSSARVPMRVPPLQPCGNADAKIFG